MPLLVNVAVFQAGWLLTVLGGANEMPWVGPLAAGIALAIHLRAARQAVEELLLVLCCAMLGALFDSLLVASGWVSYASGQFSPVLAPYWIVTLWMLFATTLNVSLRWLRGRPGLACAFGAAGGPLAYLTGQQLGGIGFDRPAAALIALAVGWGVLMPLLIRLAENLDGMPGRRRNWVRAGA